jgi:hypothetical protein
MTALDWESNARLMEGSCEVDDCPVPGPHGSYGWGSGGGEEGNTTTSTEPTTTTTVTETTTTTYITRVTGTMQLTLSDVAAMGDLAALELAVTKTIAYLAGYGRPLGYGTPDFSFTTVEMPQEMTSTFTVTYHLDVSNVQVVSPAEAEENLAALTDTQIAEALAMRVGSCSYTLVPEGWTAAPTADPNPTPAPDPTPAPAPTPLEVGGTKASSCFFGAALAAISMLAAAM